MRTLLIAGAYAALALALLGDPLVAVAAAPLALAVIALDRRRQAGANNHDGR